MDKTLEKLKKEYEYRGRIIIKLCNLSGIVWYIRDRKTGNLFLMVDING
jgi:hypothetical protein